jgi:integral membrane sensor domain MASE1
MAGAPAEASSRRALSGVALVGATAGVYVVAAKLGLSLAFVAAQVTTVWPPTGIALAALVLFEPRFVWIGIALGAFAANASQGEPIATAAGIAAGNTLEAVVGAWLLRRTGFHPALARVRDALALVTVAAAATTLAATIGVVSLCAAGVQPWSSFSMLWWTWWVGDALGALVAAPLILVWAVRPATPPPARRFEAIGLAIVTATVGTVAFTIVQQPPLAAYPLHYIVFPVVVWAALRFGPRGVASVTFLVSTLAILYSVRGLEHLGGPSPHQRLFVLQLFMAVVAVTGLLLAAASAERDASRARGAIDLVRMQESEERLRLALDAGRMGVWDWNLVTGCRRAPSGAPSATSRRSCIPTTGRESRGRSRTPSPGAPPTTRSSGTCAPTARSAG